MANGKKCRLVSCVNHPIELSYDGKSMMIPPRAGRSKNKIIILNSDKLGAIPRGIKKIDIKG